ncbi:lysophospholipase [Rhodotorula diobovata]|uniref:Lysophospholipase n=1 Tax=Rhodotorula diobovata TaxID=5288 RepID=A0A5C5FMD8_9BASI|nr:lysophospholipase [Rhodotorula diobovata]
MVWSPPPDQAAYFSIPAPSDTHSLALQLLHRPPHGDPTWGRAALPRGPDEQRIRETHPHRDGRVYLHGSDREWVAYQVWEPAKECDLVFVHGINDFGGKFGVHASKFLDAGYRVVVPDLPGHGRSTGIHVYCPSMEALADAVYEVIKDVALQDYQLVQEAGGAALTQTRKVFVGGQSLGGFTAALTCLKYGAAPLDTSLPSAAAAAAAADANPGPGDSTGSTSFRPTISGGLFLCPMLAISPDSRPSPLVELAARALASVAGPLPFASANRGKNSEDPEVEEVFDRDPQTYHGKLRIATGLAILNGILDLTAQQSHLRVPFLLCHGTGDRVTSFHGSEALLRCAESADKELKLYPEYQHILLRKGRDEQDDARRQHVLGDMLDWLERH